VRDGEFVGIYSSGGLRKMQAEDESSSAKSRDEELFGVVRVGSGRMAVDGDVAWCFDGEACRG
jgi:hypothetical protein